MSDVQVTHNEAEQRYEARLGEALAGTASYESADDLVVFTHTVVEDAYEGQGVGSALARAALDDVRRQGGRRVVARCSFIRGWIDKHSDYQDLVD